MKSRITLVEEMHLMGELDGFSISLDADVEFGGKNKGPKPKGLVLTALAGCTGLDVISILRKMRVKFTDFYVDAEAEVSEAHPKVFTKIIISYYIKGEDVTLEKIQKAVDLSLTNYCGVAAMLKKTAPIESKIIILN